MLIVTTPDVPGEEVKEVLGLVRGSTVRARNVGRDFMAGLKNIVGGEISEYTSLLAKAREEAMRRMAEEALRMDADAIINVRLNTSAVMNGAAEILAYGTAVKLSNRKISSEKFDQDQN